MTDNTQQFIQDFVDYLMPALDPYESSLYVLLFRYTLEKGSNEFSIGKRSIAAKFGLAGGGNKGIISYDQVSKVLKKLERKGCIIIGDTNREGTMYTLVHPHDIPLVKEKLADSSPVDTEEDFFTNTEKRCVIFERDNWICQYCGDKINRDNASIDHYVPQSKGGNHSKENLRACCFVCNSIKSGKSYEDAAPFILKSIQERKQKHNK